MELRKVTQDILSVPPDCYIAHCISDDFTLGAGLAKKIDEKYDMKARLNDKYRKDCPNESYVGRALLIDHVFNLVNKENFRDSADIEDLKEAIENMRLLITILSIHKLAIPRLGCGKDKLNWDEVRGIIIDTFKNMDNIEITICEL